MTDEEMMYLKRLASVIDAKICAEHESVKPYTLVALQNDKLYLIQRALVYYISRHEKLRGML